MSRRRIATAIVSLVALAVLAACSDDTDPATTEPPADDPAAPVEPSAPELAAPDVVDGAVRDHGVIVPIPAGWDVDAQAFAQGVVVTGPSEAPETAAILAASGVQDNPMLGLQGAGFDDALEAMRGIQSDGTLVTDEEISFAGAEQAWMLLFEGVAGQADMPDTDQLIVLAIDADAQIALFNYSSVTGEYDRDVEALLLADGGLDPDSSPIAPQMPDVQPTP